MDMDLAAQPTVVFYKKSLIQHGKFVVRRFGNGMIAFHINLAGGAHGHTATFPCYRQFLDFANLHQVQVHVCWGNHMVYLPFTVNYADLDIVAHGLQN